MAYAAKAPSPNYWIAREFLNFLSKEENEYNKKQYIIMNSAWVIFIFNQCSPKIIFILFLKEKGP